MPIYLNMCHLNMLMELKNITLLVTRIIRIFNHTENTAQGQNIKI